MQDKSTAEQQKALKTNGFQGFDGGDKRDRTADLLNAIQALSRSDRLHPPLNQAKRAFNTRDTRLTFEQRHVLIECFPKRCNNNILFFAS